MLAKGVKARPRPATLAVKGMYWTFEDMKKRPMRNAVVRCASPTERERASQREIASAKDRPTSIDSLAEVRREGVGDHTVLDRVGCPGRLVASAKQYCLKSTIFDGRACREASYIINSGSSECKGRSSIFDRLHAANKRAKRATERFREIVKATRCANECRKRTLEHMRQERAQHVILDDRFGFDYDGIFSGDATFRPGLGQAEVNRRRLM